jgi:hypothetical protein
MIPPPPFTLLVFAAAALNATPLFGKSKIPPISPDYVRRKDGWIRIE